MSEDAWSTVAAGWAARRPTRAKAFRPVTSLLLDRLDLRIGDVVLELACGDGDAGLAAATLVGESGRAILTDGSRHMVDQARARAAELGLRNVELMAADMTATGLRPGSVDRVLCQFGLMLAADPAAALHEWRRVLRGGGRLGLAVWRERERNPSITLLGDVLVAHGLRPANAPGDPSPFALTDGDHLASLIREAGFGPPTVEEVAVSFEFVDVDDYVDYVRQSSCFSSQSLQTLDGDEMASVVSDTAAALAPYADGNRLRLPGAALVASALG